MNDRTRIMRRPRRAPSAARTAAAIIATAALALLATACSGSASPTSPGNSADAAGSATSPSAVGYSHCIRSHGVPSYPDPGSNGQLPKGDAQQFGVSTSQYQAAQQACQHLLPTGGSLAQQQYQCMENSDCAPALVQQMMAADMKVARCMRSHGVPNFPDPTNGGSSGPIFNITNAGISDAASHAPRFETELNGCASRAGPHATEDFE
jgi:hypothetical protein